MTIEFHCPHCEKLLKTPDDKAGVRANCPGCGQSVTVPAASELGAVDDSFDSGPSRLAAGERSALSSSGRAAASDATKACPMCGETIKAAATRCRYCGENLVGSGPSRRALAPHRGGMILAFGIIGLVICLPFGIAAWVMGNNDLREMADGRMDPAGEGLTRSGKVIGIISCCLALLGICVNVVFIAIAILGNLN